MSDSGTAQRPTATAVGLLLMDFAGRALLYQRSPESDHPDAGLWSIPTARQFNDEPHVETATRLARQLAGGHYREIIPAKLISLPDVALFRLTERFAHLTSEHLAEAVAMEHVDPREARSMPLTAVTRRAITWHLLHAGTVRTPAVTALTPVAKHVDEPAASAADEPTGEPVALAANSAAEATGKVTPLLSAEVRDLLKTRPLWNGDAAPVVGHEEEDCAASPGGGLDLKALLAPDMPPWAVSPHPGLSGDQWAPEPFAAPAPNLRMLLHVNAATMDVLRPFVGSYRRASDVSRAFPDYLADA
ncbi:hypothetical protein [Kitasatospora sp. NPDC017646]|uniref:hypothetical protein n=1 Tax=Kitasatospora sp. NPDC017646 TaxID=3364024 RepID=UPI00378835B7